MEAVYVNACTKHSHMHIFFGECFLLNTAVFYTSRDVLLININVENVSKPVEGEKWGCKCWVIRKADGSITVEMSFENNPPLGTVT